jgi:hypothetical protein
MNWHRGRVYQRQSAAANKADFKEIVRRDLLVDWFRLDFRTAGFQKFARHIIQPPFVEEQLR